MKALIDADILLYRVGYTTENEPEHIAEWRMNELVHRIIEATEAESYVLYLSAGRTDTFRARLNPEYKANRTQPKPTHYDFLKKYLIEEWKAEVQVDQEADDALGIEQTRNQQEYYDKACPVSGTGDWENHNYTVICSIDKDLLQIPGYHYNFVKEEFNTVTDEEGLLFFYKQLLIGDTADNIKGVTGIGKAKADKILNPLLGASEQEIFLKVQETYRNWLQQEWIDQYEEWGDFEEKQMNNIIQLTGQLLKIRTKEDEVWRIPSGCNLKPETIPM